MELIAMILASVPFKHEKHNRFVAQNPHHHR
jgi:hypothetical protein